jgi:hypothetical protein
MAAAQAAVTATPRAPLSLAALGILAHEQEQDRSGWGLTQTAEYFGTTRRVIWKAYEELWDKEML